MALVRWTARATRDLRAIYDYIAADNPIVARRLIGQLIAAADRLREFPDSGRPVPRFEQLGVREVISSPYRIAYRSVEGEVRIIKVHHGARLIHASDLLEESD